MGAERFNKIKMGITTLTVNLDLPPRARWGFLIDYKDEIDELISCYLNDFQGAEYLFEEIRELKHKVIQNDYLEEIACIAAISKFSDDQVLLANLYYDILKFYFGCTAFALETNQGMLHARNLDWWTENNILSKFSKIFDFQRNGQTVFKTVGWVGFVGALSGVKPNHFSISLNAVSSSDLPQVATPISFLLRDVLDGAGTYADAQLILEQTSIASDCLLLLAGTQKGEKLVIERTPKRSATRVSNSDFIIVTNDYKLLENNETGTSELQATSCRRYDRAEQLLAESAPKDMQGCLSVLKDDRIVMAITVQQMVFDIGSGEITLVTT